MALELPHAGPLAEELGGREGFRVEGPFAVRGGTRTLERYEVFFRDRNAGTYWVETYWRGGVEHVASLRYREAGVRGVELLSVEQDEERDGVHIYRRGDAGVLRPLVRQDPWDIPFAEGEVRKGERAGKRTA